MTLHRGLYDTLVTSSLARAIESGNDIAQISRLPNDEIADRVAEALSRQMRAILEMVAGEGDARQLRQLDLVNTLLGRVRDDNPRIAAEVDPVSLPVEILRGVYGTERPAYGGPQTGLSAPWLFTAGKGTPTLLNELRLEAAA